MVLDDPNCYQDACPLMGGCVPSVYCSSKEWSLWCYEGVNWLLSFKKFINYQSIGYYMWCDPKSYNRSYVHFCVPRILEVFTNDPCTGTTNDCICCLHQLSIHVGVCPICRPWFSRVLIDCEAFLCICRLVLSLHHHPQLYIAWYMVVKAGMLIWQVNTKRNNSKIFPNLLV